MSFGLRKRDGTPIGLPWEKSRAQKANARRKKRRENDSTVTQRQGSVISLPASSCVSGVPISSVGSSMSCAAAATSSSAAPALPVGRATLLSAGSGSCTGSAGRERLGTTGSLLGVSAGTFRRDGARFRDKVLLSGCWVSCCRAWLRRFWFTNSMHVTVAFELSPAVCTPSDGTHSSLRMRCPSVCFQADSSLFDLLVRPCQAFVNVQNVVWDT